MSLYPGTVAPPKKVKSERAAGAERMETATRERLQELAQFLRTRRARISPEQAGLPGGGRRRTPGLRREEVAQLAGVSVDWYTWLEQARDIQVSAQVLENIAKALQLDGSERRHLYLLALQQLPADDPLPAPGGVSPALQRFLDLQGASPAYATDRRLDIVTWNKAASAIYGDYAAMSERERNAVWRTFTSPYVRLLLQDGWEAHARHRLAHFRAQYGKFAGDPWWMAMIEDLREASAEFREWWPQHDVLSGPEGMKINYHPAAGRLVFEQISFVVTDAPHLTVTVNIPSPEDGTAARVARLMAEQ